MKTAMSGPLIVYGQRNTPGLGQGGTNNPDKSSSIFERGVALLDGRAGYNVTKPGALGYQGSDSMMILDAVPATLSATNIVTSQAPVAGTPITLNGASTGITVVAAGGVKIWSAGNTVPAGALCLDGTPGLLTQYGALTNPYTNYAAVMFYDVTKTIARNVRVTTNADDTGGFYTVAGYDIYGFPMSEKITGVSSGVAAGKKAFKYVVSITPSGTINSTAVTIGTGDVIGFPLLVPTVGYVSIWYNNGLAVAVATPFGTASAFTFADTTNPATNITGDVRGTIYLGTANPSNATRRLQISWTPSINSQTVDGGIFGVTQA